MKKIPVGVPDISQEELEKVTQVVKSGWIALGKEKELFEQKLAAYLDVKHVITVNSGTAAIEVALRSLGIENREIITTTTSCSPTANAIIHSGNKPVMVDVSLEDYNIDPTKIEEKINENTGAILPVHIYGRMADMEKIMVLANRYNLPVIEDCAQAMGATLNGKMSGTFGEIGCFSLNINKIITTGEGGFICTNDQEVADMAKKIRNYGRDPSGTDYCYTDMGHNFKFTNLQAAIGLAQLGKIDDLIKARRSNVNYLKELLKDVPEIILPSEKEHEFATYFSFTILLKKAGLRNKLKEFLESKNIEVRTMFRPMCDQPYYVKMFGKRIEEFPNAEKIGNDGLYVGCYPSLTKEQLNYLARCIKEGLHGNL